MEKIIWVIGNDRREMIDAQRQINSTGSMRASCLLSFEAVQKAVEQQGEKREQAPSLIILDYEMSLKEEYRTLAFLKAQQHLAGVPLFFMANERNQKQDEECYAKGATVVLHKPFGTSGILRIERTAWQHEVTKNYEKMLQKQAGELQTAKEILTLNQQLEARNALLYQIFGRYFSDEVVDVILKDPQGAAIGGCKQEVTIMMADLRGFTSMSEEMGPEELTQLLNLYFAKMIDVIAGYHGTVIEFLGDAILAVFGAPISSEKQTEDAVAAAIAMQNAMPEVNQFCMEKNLPVLEMGIAIHRGEVFIGNIGSEKMMRYNVIGQAVNECSRIEGYSIGGQILVSASTIQKMNQKVRIKSQIEISAKGIQNPILAVEVIGIGEEVACQLSENVGETFLTVKDWILFNMHPIRNKVIQENTFPGMLIEFSGKRAIVELRQDDEQLQMYSDVAFFISGKTGEIICSGIYAKIVEKEELKITLHFTHVNAEFHAFCEQLKKEETSEKR